MRDSLDCRGASLSSRKGRAWPEPECTMSPNSRKIFRVVLETIGERPRFVIARIPVDLKKAWSGWQNRRVIGEINGFAFRTTLFSQDRGTRHMLVVNRRMQTGARAGPDAEVRIWLEPDLKEQPLTEPAELKRALKEDRQLRRWFDALSPSMRKGIGGFVDQARGAATRALRAGKVAEGLMLAMEGEQTPPPILRAAFQRQPMAQDGWAAMTPTQRRNHLLGIFLAQAVNGRERRAARAIEECLRVARKRNRNV